MIDAIFVPRGAEEGAVRSALARARADVRVVVMGIGPAAAARAADGILAAMRPRNALVAGLCGLLSPAFVVGDTLVYREIARAGERPLVLEPALGDAVAARVPGAQTGIRALASERIVGLAVEKLALGRETGADAVDMESYDVAVRLQRAGIATAVVRVASDGVADDLPDLAAALDGAGGVDGRRLAIAMLRRPRAGAALARNGMRALRDLRRAVYAIVAASGDVAS